MTAPTEPDEDGPGEIGPEDSAEVRALQAGAVQTPIGWLNIEADTNGVTRAFFADAPLPDASGDPHGAVTAVKAWLGGDHAALTRVRIADLGSRFQHEVWRGLRAIPAGTTWTYAELAERLGRPSASRAVARANATNPIAVIVPCHRVVGSDGSMRGYAGGLHRKRWLLAHEGAPGFLVP